MTIQRMDHVGIVVDDLAAAMAFFVELGLELEGEAPVEGHSVDRVVGLAGPGGQRDDTDPRRAWAARADQVPHAVGSRR